MHSFRAIDRKQQAAGLSCLLPWQAGGLLGWPAPSMSHWAAGKTTSMFPCQLFGCLTSRWTCKLPGWLPGSPFVCWLIYLLPSSPASWQIAQFNQSWVRLWAQNSLFCKAGDRSVGVLFSSNLECPMKQKFPSQQALVVSLQYLSVYSVPAIMSP